MTENQLITQDLQFAVNYTPSKITIENEEQLESLIDQVTEFYGNQIFTDKNIAEAKQARKELNSYVDKLEGRRKEIKADFTIPLNEFEGKMKSFSSRIKEISDEINSGIKRFDEAEKAVRLEKLQQEIAKLADPLNVDPNAVEISTAWLNKAAFTTKGEVRGKTLDEIHDKLKLIAMERDRIAADKETVTAFADIAGLDPYAWADKVDLGWSVADIRDQIKQAVADKQLREEQAEKDRLAQEEYEAAMASVNQTTLETGAVIDQETGEVIQPAVTEEIESLHADSPQMTVTLRITGTAEQLNALNDFLVDRGIGVEPVQ